MVTKNTRLNSRLIRRASTSAVISRTGARTQMRVAIKSVPCTEATSLVKRVMRDAVEKCSKSAKEKRWTWAYSAARTFEPKPMAARAAARAAPTPNSRASTAKMSILRPIIKM